MYARQGGGRERWKREIEGEKERERMKIWNREKGKWESERQAKVNYCKLIIGMSHLFII